MARTAVVVATMALAVMAAAAPVRAGDGGRTGACTERAEERAGGEKARIPAQSVAQSGAATLPGVGAVTVQVGWDGRQQQVLQASDFVLSRTFDPLTRET